MKRITYISQLTPGVTAQDINAIAAVSVRNNQRLGVTGVLLYTAGIFFQIIEGEAATLDALYTKIAADPRHADVICLHSENMSARLYPHWDMHTINLDQADDPLTRPFKALLQHLGQTHQIIQKYTQPAVTQLLESGVNPLLIPARTCEKIILFSDIVGFSRLSEDLPVTEVAALVNCYLDIVSQCISAYGGEVSKYIGDSVMAYFSPAQADAALQAGREIIQRLSAQRAQAPAGSAFAQLSSGVGLAAGTVLEGNFGSALKMDYTIIGDAVNIAARLESLTRHLGYPVLLSRAVMLYCVKPWPFIPVGRHPLKGKNVEVDVFGIEI
jgi:adenylate cyclase